MIYRLPVFFERRLDDERLYVDVRAVYSRGLWREITDIARVDSAAVDKTCFFIQQPFRRFVMRPELFTFPLILICFPVTTECMI